MQSLKLIVIITILITAVSLFAQWSEPRRISGGGLYPCILVKGDTIHVVYTKLGGRAKIEYLRSIDQGITWSNGVVLNDTINYNNAFFPELLRNEHKLMILWFENPYLGQLRNIAYEVSNDAGRTWSVPQHIMNPGLENLYLFSAAYSDSVINVIFSRLFLSRMRFYSVRSTNFGQTWSSPLEIFDCEETSFSDMVAYGDTFHFVWTGNFEQGVNWELYYSRSVDEGLAWSDPETLSTPGGRGARHASLSINETGKIGMCWTDFRYAPPGWIGDLFYAKSLDQGESWEGETQLTFIHQDEYSDIFYTGDTIHVVFERGFPTTKKICYTKSTDDGATWEPEVEIDLDPADSHNPEVGYGNGRTYIFWCDERDNPDSAGYGGLYFSRCPPGDTVDIDETDNLPNSIGLTAYPNPFNSSISLYHSFKDTKGGELTIYNIQGQSIISFNLEGKEGIINWDARDAVGNKVCSGIYFARASASQNSYTCKLLFLK